MARTGPDEFAVLLHATDARSAAIWADRFEDELAGDLLRARRRPAHLLDRHRRHRPRSTLIQAAAKAHRRMEVIQTVRKLRRAREGGGLEPGPA